MDTPGAIPEVSLIGLSAVTHSFNSSQRRLKLPVTQSGALLRVTMPGSANLAPPGYYLLTVLNAARVPSPGVIIALNAAAVPQRSVTAILPR
jgi:galactose oxidase